MSTVYEHVTADIVKSLDQGVVPWIKPWKDDGKATSPWGLPLNIATGREYRGANVPLLWSIRQRNGYQNDQWMTLKQANALGGSILKGERASWVHFYLWKEDATTKKRFPILKAYRVFNVDQTQGCELPQRTAFQELGAGDLENRVRELGARVRLGGNRAYFDVNGDRIALPLPEQFRDSGNFHSTLAHEMVHWTGHSSRLDRPLNNHFGTPEYAREELVAELGSAFVCARFGIDLKGLQHPEYLASWLKVLKEDSRAIMRAASAAQRACDLIVGTKADQPEEEAKEEESSRVAVSGIIPVPAIPSIIPDPVPSIPDTDTQALAAQMIGEVARVLYWTGVKATNEKPVKAKPVKPIKARKAKRAKGEIVTGYNWQRHPVTGWPMNVPVGKDIRDVIPYGHDPKLLARVGKHFKTHARIGAANVLTYLEIEGMNPTQYRAGLVSRRKEAGAHSYNYGPRAIDPAVVIEIDHGRSRREDSSIVAVA